VDAAGYVAAEERSRALLLSHLTEEQRGDLEVSGTFRIVKDGVQWRTVLSCIPVPGLLVGLGVLGPSIPGLEVATMVAGVGIAFLVASFLFWIPPLAIACTRRRVWILGPGRRPALLCGARRIEFCVRVRGDVPDGDRVLAYKNVLDANERYFLRKANALV
jgi:hypothetical protein